MICNRCINTLLTMMHPSHHGHQLHVPVKSIHSMLTNNLKSNQSPWLPLLVWRCNATTWKRGILMEQEKKKVVLKFATKNTKRTNRVYVWGNAVTGALGIRSFLQLMKTKPLRKIQHVPHRMDFWAEKDIKVKQAASGYGYTVYLCRNKHGKHQAFGCGLNMDSQLGYQSSPPKSDRILDYVISPALIDLPLLEPEVTKLTNVACGRAHTWLVTDNEGIFSLGNNAHGQCGRPVVEDEVHRGSQMINKVSFDKKVKQICCGSDHTLVLTDEGEVYSCGLGVDGQTGQGHHDRVEQLSKVIGDINGENIISIAARADCVLAVSDKGDVFGWGSSEYGQLSVASPDMIQLNVARYLPFTNTGKVIQAAATSSMCAVLNDEGSVYVWGNGVLGKGPNLDHCETPEMLPPPLFGQNELNPDQKVVDLQAGHNNLAALTESGQLYMWGKNPGASLGMGLGHRINQYFPFKVEVPAEVQQVTCGADHTVVVCKSFV